MLDQAIVVGTHRSASANRGLQGLQMKRINLALTEEELKLLASLASDQLFRRQFIDPRMPGYKGSKEDLDLGKSLVARMRLMIDEGSRHTPSALAQGSRSKG
jgi:hypothetical protein